jgi:sentrin-specific protease 7
MDHTNTLQPAANLGFKPVDTLTRGNGGHGSTKPKLYGRKTFGSTPTRGQQAFLDQHSSGPNTPARKPSPRDTQSHRLIGSSPAKRRKTGHVSPPQIIDLSEDDDLQEISSHHTPTASALKEYDMPASAYSVRSRQSIGSNPAISGRQSGSQSKNEFQEIEEMMKSKLPKSKSKSTPGGQRRPSIGRSGSGSVTPGYQAAPVYLPDDRDEPTARRALLESFNQGVSDRASTARVLPHQADETTSRHFPKARINESTADARGHNLSGRQEDDQNKDLRHLRRCDMMVEDDLVSDDELGMNLPHQQAVTTKKQRSGSNTTKVANSGAKRTSKAAMAAKSRPLIWARSHDFDSHQFTKAKDDKACLWLKPGADSNTWRIVAHDADGIYDTKATITPRDVTRVCADDVGRIRLEGPKGHDGNHSIFDLEFWDTEDYISFRDKHVIALLGRPILPPPKDESYMKVLFDKPLVRNNKVGTLPLITNENLVVDEAEATHTGSKDQPLWSRMKSGAQSRNLSTSNSEKTGSPMQAGVTQASARPTRAARASAPVHDTNEGLDDPTVEKHSVIHGLGKPWRDSLNFSEGRYRATVNFADLPRLDEGELLNDNLIDFYMIYCFKQYNVPKDKVYFFNTFFFSTLTENTGRASINYQAVERWTSKIDVFDYDYIVVPINEETHWYLAIICNVGNIERRAIQEDFTHGSANDIANEKNDAPQQLEAAANELPAELGLVDTSKTSMSSRAPSAEKVVDDGNLFDEESKLDLIDREQIAATAAKQKTSPPDSSVPQSPEDSAAPAAPSNFDDVDAPKTVLSSLKASPKKKAKRKFTAPKKDPNQPIIIILDSLSSARSTAVRALKDWLAAEGKARRNMEAVITEKGFYPKSNQIPTQSNFSDCGVYLLGYAEKFFQDPDEFKTKLLRGEMTAEDDWPQLKPADMRNSLRAIIQGLAKEQELTLPKKQRGKNIAVVNKSRITQPPVEPTKAEATPALPQEPKHAETTKTTEKPSDTLATGSVPPVALGQTPHKPIVARLGSPFSPKPSVKLPVSDDEASTASGKPLAIASVSTAKTTIVSPSTKPSLVRRTHPEVRIPKRSPASQLPRLDAQVGTASSQANGMPHGTGSVPRSVSPLKRTRPESDTIDALQVPSKKNKSSPTVQSPRQQLPSRTSPILPPPQEGHSDRPIEIMDSQETGFAATQSPQHVQAGSPAQRKQPSRSPRTAQTLRHAPSLEEITSFPPNTIQRKPLHSEKPSVDNQLIAELNADDKQRQKTKQAKFSSRQFPVVLQRAEEPEIMDIDSQGVDLMDTADDVVPESPVSRRGSPSPDEMWVSGESLPS